MKRVLIYQISFLILIFFYLPNLILQAQVDILLVDSLTGDSNAISVCEGGRFDIIYSNINDATTCALPGDTIVLSEGIYLGNLLIEKSLTISGSEAATTMIQGDGVGSTITVQPDVSLILDGVSVSGGNAVQGGGIFTLTGKITINNSVISNNSASEIGSGIFTYAGSVEINGSTISGNATTDNGGGLATVAGTIILNDSTISDHTVNNDGGGIYTAAATVKMTNTTIAGNSATVGGGLQNLIGALDVNNVTIAQNSATTGGGINIETGLVTIRNSLLANNMGNDCIGIVLSLGYNLIESPDTDCVIDGDLTGNQIGVDPLLGEFGDYDGVSGNAPFLFELLNGSPAENSGSPSDQGEAGACAPFDQRGASRLDNNCDIGSYEGVRSDCNGDLGIDAGDLAALRIEIFDNDSSSDPNLNFPGNSLGCDANGDFSVDAGDLACVRLTIFNGIGVCG